jgi:hypothetical protein
MVGATPSLRHRCRCRSSPSVERAGPTSNPEPNQTHQQNDGSERTDAQRNHSRQLVESTAPRQCVDTPIPERVGGRADEAKNGGR